LFCLVYFTLSCLLLYIKNTKKISIYYSFYFCCSVLILLKWVLVRTLSCVTLLARITMILFVHHCSTCSWSGFYKIKHALLNLVMRESSFLMLVLMMLLLTLITSPPPRTRGRGVLAGARADQALPGHAPWRRRGGGTVVFLPAATRGRHGRGAEQIVLSSSYWYVDKIENFGHYTILNSSW
jgi:hypothetical protein